MSESEADGGGEEAGPEPDEAEEGLDWFITELWIILTVEVLIGLSIREAEHFGQLSVKTDILFLDYQWSGGILENSNDVIVYNYRLLLNHCSSRHLRHIGVIQVSITLLNINVQLYISSRRKPGVESLLLPCSCSCCCGIFQSFISCLEPRVVFTEAKHSSTEI